MMTKIVKSWNYLTETTKYKKEFVALNRKLTSELPKKCEHDPTISNLKC